MYTSRSSRVMALSLASILACAELKAGEHIAPLDQLRQDGMAIGQQREAHLASVDELLNLEAVKTALEKGKIDAKQVHQAAALLSEDELSRLGARAAKLRADVEAGALTNQQLTYIVIALATAVIILVVVVA